MEKARHWGDPHIRCVYRGDWGVVVTSYVPHPQHRIRQKHEKETRVKSIRTTPWFGMYLNPLLIWQACRQTVAMPLAYQ